MRSDLIVAGSAGSWDRGDDEDVFYETRSAEHVEHAEHAEHTEHAEHAAPVRPPGADR